MLILVHSPKGGAGSSFLTAALAASLVRRGRQVAAVDFTFQDSLKLYFGLLPNQPLEALSYPRGDAMAVAGVELMNGHAFSREQAFVDAMHAGDLSLLDKDRIAFADIASDDRELKQFLMEHATLHICPMLPQPASLATLAKVEPGTPAVDLAKTVFVLNQLDDRRRLSRHTRSFVQELLGDKLLGAVRYDEALNEAVAMFEPLAKFAPSSVLLPDVERLTDALEARLGLAASSGTADTQRVA